MSSGIELDERDPSIHPGDDLYRHMNGLWLERSEIPADKSRYGAFTVLAEEAEKAVLDIIERAKSAPAGSEAKKVGDLYESFMDEARIEEVGLRPLQDMIARIEAALPGGHEDLVGALGDIERSGVEGLWRLFVDNDPGNPERYVMFVEQGGLSLPDQSYYRKAEHAEILKALEVHIERMFTLGGLGDAGARAKRVIDVETRIAAGHWDNVKSRDAEATYNMWSGDQLEKALGSFGWKQWLSGTGIPAASVGEIVVRQPSFITSLAKTWMASSPEALADWMSWHTITAFAPYLTGEVVQAHFDFFGTTLSGTPELRARWKRGVSFVEAVMGEAVGKLYVEEHFPSAAKHQMDELVAMLLAAYRESITELSWMGPETKKKALDKLDTFRPKIGYPSVWRDYSTLTVTPGDLWANVIAGNEFEFARELRKIGSPLDRDEWFMTPQTVNAYYNPGFNEIVFPAAILQYPFFDPARDAASNYGAIGAVIGHEIAHALREHGRERMSQAYVQQFGIQAIAAVLTRGASTFVGNASAKAAIDNLTKWLSVELAHKHGPNFRVNAIAPGFFLTEQNRALLTESDGSLTQRGNQIITHTPMNRFGKPEDLLGALHWLCSDASVFVTGTIVAVDGGFSAYSGV